MHTDVQRWSVGVDVLTGCVVSLLPKCSLGRMSTPVVSRTAEFLLVVLSNFSIYTVFRGFVQEIFPISCNWGRSLLCSFLLIPKQTDLPAISVTLAWHQGLEKHKSNKHPSAPQTTVNRDQYCGPPARLLTAFSHVVLLFHRSLTKDARAAPSQSWRWREAAKSPLGRRRCTISTPYSKPW